MGQMKRAVTANGDRIKELRTARGWKAEDLAANAELNLKTIRTAESGKGVDVASLGLLAVALGVQVGDLVAEKQRRVQIKITTVFEFENFSDKERDAFLAMLERNIPACGAIVVQEISRGSTVITLEMDDDDLDKLRRSIEQMLSDPSARKPTDQNYSITRLPDGKDAYEHDVPLPDDLDDLDLWAIQRFEVMGASAGMDNP